MTKLGDKMFGDLKENMAQFGRAQWRLAVLVPSWASLMAILLGSMGIFAYRLAETMEHYKERNQGGEVPIIEVVWEATNIAFSVASLILTIIEISKYVAETLTPFFLLSSNVIKITLAVAELALDIIVYRLQSDREYSIVGLALDCGILAVTMLTFIYALLTFRRLLKYDDYDLTDDNKMHDNLEMGNTVHITSTNNSRKRSHSNASVVNFNPSTSYESQTTGAKRQLDQAISVEFGWGTGKASPGLSSGEVHSGKGGSVDVAPRHQSWVSERVNPNVNLAAYDDDDMETIRISHDVPRGEMGGAAAGRADEEDDSRALLGLDGPRHDDVAETHGHEPRYQDHPQDNGPRA